MCLSSKDFSFLLVLFHGPGWETQREYDITSPKFNESLKMLRDEILTWRHPVSAAQGFSAEPPSWPSHPQTLVFSPPALCTGPPSSSSSVHGVARASIQNSKQTQEAFGVEKCQSLSLKKWTGLSAFQRHFTSSPKGFSSTKITGVTQIYTLNLKSMATGFLNTVGNRGNW